MDIIIDKTKIKKTVVIKTDMDEKVDEWMKRISKVIIEKCEEGERQYCFSGPWWPPLRAGLVDKLTQLGYDFEYFWDEKGPHGFMSEVIIKW